jgi:Ca2+-binding RTX toxin-like protein
MATQFVNSTLTDVSPVINLGVTDSLVVGRDGFIVATNFLNAAVVGIGSFHTIRLEGTIFGLNGIELGDSAAGDQGQNIFINETGVINGTSNGIMINGFSSTIVNYGLIGGGSRAIRIDAIGPDETRIVNHGVIQGNFSGIECFAGTTDALHITNSGEISVEFVERQSFAIETLAGADIIRNTGELTGHISLGDNNDIFDSRGGRLDGTVYGEAGVDRLTGGAQAEGFSGGAGRDILAGGGGADAFIYATASEGRDRITDWKTIDRFEIDASGFGAGLTTGALAASRFRARADNQAQDANDRFILRTGDETLWFDANGSAAGGLKLIADLQDGARLTAGDILLV